MFRIVGELLHPIAQLRHMHAQVLRSLHIGHASLLDQAHSLKLEFAGKLPSLHDPPPAPSKHLTRCPRNRVQAIAISIFVKKPGLERSVWHGDLWGGRLEKYKKLADGSMKNVDLAPINTVAPYFLFARQ